MTDPVEIDPDDLRALMRVLLATFGDRVTNLAAESIGIPQRYLHQAVIWDLARLERATTSDVAVYVIKPPNG